MPTTEDVFQHHLQAFGAFDIDQFMVDYAEESVLLGPSGVVKGKDAIRTVFSNVFKEFNRPDTTFVLKTKHIEGEYVFIEWEAETSANHHEYVTDTFVVRNGKIVLQSSAGVIRPKA